jgi:cysteine dioxygenase
MRSEPECISVEQLIDGVNALLESGHPERVSDFVTATPIHPDSLTPFTHFRDAHYTRNLIFKNDLFEMLLLCWGVGHRSWIHNHQGEHCWMAVTQGTLAVRNYKRISCDQQLRTLNLEPLPEVLISPGSIAKVDPIEPIHLVWNPAEYNQPAVSIHIYSLPFESCVVYDADHGLCRNVTLFYTSEYGTVTDQHKGGRKFADMPACACTLNTAQQNMHCGIAPQVTGPQISL